MAANAFNNKQAVEKVRQIRSRIVQTLSGGPGRLTNSAARTHVVLLIRRTVRPRGYVEALHSLRPCWTGFLNRLRVVRGPSPTHLRPTSQQEG